MSLTEAMASSTGSPVALVTGGGSGIGRATAVHFAKAGCSVVAADINVEGAEETCKLIQGTVAGADCVAVECDISCPAEVSSLMGVIKQRFARLDYAFNNAGICGNAAAIHETPLEEFDRVMSVNVRGHFIAMQAQIPLMLATSPSPAIVFTSSVAGHKALPGIAPYIASKHAVRGLVKTAAVEYGPRGLRVNSVSPGGINTPMLEALETSGAGAVVMKLLAEGASLAHAHAPGITTTDAHARAPAAADTVALEAPPAATPTETAAGTGTEAAAAADVSDSKHVPLRRVGQPEDIAACVVWLCMHGHYVSGTDVAVDGGLMSRIAM